MISTLEKKNGPYHRPGCLQAAKKANPTRSVARTEVNTVEVNEVDWGPRHVNLSLSLTPCGPKPEASGMLQLWRPQPSASLRYLLQRRRILAVGCLGFGVQDLGFRVIGFRDS